MAEPVPLTLETLGGGALSEDFSRALQRVLDSYDNTPGAEEAARKITITVEFKRGARDDYLTTFHKVETKLPVVGRGGTVWMDDDQLVTQLNLRDRTSQQGLFEGAFGGAGKPRGDA
ncbi:MAG: hypothetical protein ABIL09_04475 [Gemmatimonadota bacterium]